MDAPTTALVPLRDKGLSKGDEGGSCGGSRGPMIYKFTAPVNGHVRYAVKGLFNGWFFST